MRFISDALLRFVTWLHEEKAQTMAEYGLILALVSVVAIIALLAMGPQVAAVFDYITSKISAALV